MIDVTKPLELSDGTPVTLVEATSDDWGGRPYAMFSYERFSSKGVGGRWNHFIDDGACCGLAEPEYLPIRNVVPAFDPTKPVETRDGRKARILCADRRDPEYPIVALVEVPEEGEERVLTFSPAGGFVDDCGDHRTDLVNVEPEMVHFVALGGAYTRAEYAHSAYPGYPVAKIVTQGDKVVSSELVPSDAA